jgi:CheY-like chemotaxis protein
MTSQSGKMIFIVDDDKDLLATMTDFLEFEGFAVESSATAEKALKRLDSLKPDLIILDISMPGMGGVGFLREMAGNQDIEKIPVLVFTARANMQGFFENLEVSGFLAKPCSQADMLKCIEAIIGKEEVIEETDAGTTHRAGGRRRILLAEDDGGARQRLGECLKGIGFDVIEVMSGPEIVERTIVEQPDALLLKLVLANMNGDAAVRLLSELPATRGIPVVLYDDTGSNPRNWDSLGGARRKFVRASEPDVLLEAVNAVIGAGR